jgi:hypothetical protein
MNNSIDKNINDITKDMEGFRNWLLKYFRYSTLHLEAKLKYVQQFKNVCTDSQCLETMHNRQILALIETLQPYYTPQALNTRIQGLEQYFYYLLEAGIITIHPLKNFRVKAPKPKILQGFIARDTLDSIYINFPITSHMGGQFALYSYRNKIILGLVMYQALTKTCLYNIRLDHIDLSKAQIQVPANTTTLNKRTLSLEAIQMLELRHYIEVIRPQIISLHSEQHQRKGVDADLLFPRSQTTKASIVLAAICKKVRSYYPLNDMKQLRNSCIALWLEHNNIRKVQYMAGFKNLASVEKYNQKKLRSLQESLELYKPF